LIVLEIRMLRRYLEFWKWEYRRLEEITKLHNLCEPGSSVSIVSGYGLDDWAIEVRSPTEAKGIFTLASVSRPGLGPTQTPVQCVLEVLSPGLKGGRVVTLTTHPI
jgi:hypothetical protein